MADDVSIVMVLNTPVLRPCICTHNRNYNLTTHTNYIVCVNFIYEWRNLQFKVDSERQIFGKLFIAILFTLRVFIRNLLRGSGQRNIKPTHYLLDYGDFVPPIQGCNYHEWRHLQFDIDFDS